MADVDIDYDEVVDETFLFIKYLNKFIICNSKVNDYTQKIPKIEKFTDSFEIKNLIFKTFDMIKLLVNQINESFLLNYLDQFLFVKRAIKLNKLCIDLDRLLYFIMFK
jgi:hypothetical protein